MKKQKAKIEKKKKKKCFSSFFSKLTDTSPPATLIRTNELTPSLTNSIHEDYNE